MNTYKDRVPLHSLRPGMTFRFHTGGRVWELRHFSGNVAYYYCDEGRGHWDCSRWDTRVTAVGAISMRMPLLRAA